ncbi:MAG: PH domain-containing protein [Ilumatobacteraceae bacterium]
METPGTTTGETAPFSNEPIHADGLPRVHEQRFELLDPAYARVRLVAAVGAAAAVTATMAVTSIMWSSPVPLVIGSIVLLLVLAIGTAQRIETNHMAYLVREHDVSFRSGVIGRTVATVPFARVQHVSIDRGPIDRRFGLAALQLSTAGGRIAVPGLRTEVADQLKELVAGRAAELADAETDDVEPPPT